MKVRGQQVYSPQERIERSSIPEPNSGCWLWLAAACPNPAGHLYGRITIGTRGKDRRTEKAHRYAYEAFIGSIPDGLHVCHRCDNTLCVNPDHLFAGTHQDNMDDRRRKDRNRQPAPPSRASQGEGR